MRVRPLLLAGFLVLGGFIAIAPTPVAAVIDLTPSTFANSGYSPDIHINGDVVAIVHKNNNNALILTYSTDYGETWTDRAVQVAGVGVTMNYTSARVIIHNATTFLVFYGGAFAGQNFRGVRTFDSGVTWENVPLSDAQRFNVNNDLDYVGGTLFLLGLSSVGTGFAVWTSTNFGTTWTESQVCGAIGGDNDWAALTVRSATNWTYFYSAMAGNTGVVRRADSFGQCGTQVNDPLTPLTNYGKGLRAVHDGSGVFSFHATNGTGQAYLALPQPGGTWFFVPYGPTSNIATFPDPYALSNGSVGALGITSGGPWFTDYLTSDDGGTFTQTSPEATTTTVDTDPAVVSDCNTVWRAYRSPTTGRLVVNVTEADCVGPGSENFWCSTPGATNFGYDFVEDVTRDTVDPGMEIDPYYRFSGEASDYGYLGKAWGGTQSAPAVGSTHMRSYFRIEAAADGTDTNFRSSFTFILANGTADEPEMNKGVGSTAGDDSGDFSRHIEARWLEDGNDWEIRLFYVNTTAGVTTRTAFGDETTFVGGNPNSPTSFIFEVDTVGNQTAQVKLFDETILKEQVIPASLLGTEMHGHYFVGFHTALGGQFDRRTALDENFRTDYSTCIQDVTGLTVFNGDQGTDPFTPDIPGGNETGDDDDETVSFIGVTLAPPTGFTVATFQFFLGILLMGAITGGFYFINNQALMAGVGAAVGFMLSFAFGLFPLWAVLLVALLAAAAFVLRFKSGSGG